MAGITSMFDGYKKKYLKNDFSAGLAVAAVSFPQVMAYALLAGVNPVYGLYTFIMSTIIATFTGRSSYMVVGPTNMVAVTIASSLNALEIVDAGNYMQFVFLLTFMIGAVQVVLGSLQVGSLVHFVSQPVIVGLTVGVSLIIMTSQLEKILGLTLENSGGNVLSVLYSVLTHLDVINFYAFFMGIFSIGVIIFCKKFVSWLPPYLFSVSISLIIVYLFNLENYLEVVGEFRSSLPAFNIPAFDFQEMRTLFSAALSIAILGFTQVLSIVKVMEKRTGEEAELNREFIGQGIMNMVCSFFSSFAATGSFTKSFTNLEVGAKSRISELISGLTVLLFMILFGGIVSYIPISSLAGIVILVAFYMIDMEEIKKHFSTTKFDAVIFSATFITTILTPRLDYAIYFGVIVSFILVLKNTSEINYSHISYEEDEEENFSQESLQEVKEDEYIVINLSGSLHFNTSENLKNKLNKSFREDKIFVIRMRRIENIDITAIQELEKFVDRVQASGGEVIMCGLDKELCDILKQYGLYDKIGEENCFSARDDIFRSTKKAIKKAENDVED